MSNPTFQKQLENFRESIDAIDQQLFELILKRADIVKQVGELKDEHDQTHVKIRPAREARQLKKIYEQFKDSPFPEASALMIWRHLINGSLMVESPLRVQTLHAPQALPDYAREYFGCYADLHYAADSQTLLNRLDNNEIDIAIFPMPTMDSRDFWWHNLARDENKLKIFLEFPYLPTACVRDGSRALAVSKVAAEVPNEHSHTILILEFSPDVNPLHLKEAVPNILEQVDWRCTHKVREDVMVAFLSVPYVLTDIDLKFNELSTAMPEHMRQLHVAGYVPNCLENECVKVCA